MHTLVARLDNAGDVLLTGPAVRAVAHRAAKVTFWCGEQGRAAAEMLPGVDDVVVANAPWIDPDPAPTDRRLVDGLVAAMAAAEADEALVLTSFHQSPLPAALVLRMAGVGRVGATSDDYPGSLLDVRHRVSDTVHEVERSLSLAAEMGYRLPPGDSGRLAVRGLPRAAVGLEAPYVVVHPGASVPARAWSPARHAETVDGLLAEGWRVAVTGDGAQTELTARVARTPRPGVVDLGGRTSLPQLAGVLAGADAVVVGNTGPAHLAAAVGTPVVSVFAPTVPAQRWRPWGVAHELLGEQGIACAGCRAASCPVPGHPCVGEVAAADVVDAIRRLLSDRDRTAHWAVGGPA